MYLHTRICDWVSILGGGIFFTSAVKLAIFYACKQLLYCSQAKFSSHTKFLSAPRCSFNKLLLNLARPNTLTRHHTIKNIFHTVSKHSERRRLRRLEESEDRRDKIKPKLRTGFGQQLQTIPCFFRILHSNAFTNKREERGSMREQGYKHSRHKYRSSTPSSLEEVLEFLDCFHSHTWHR